MLNSSLKPGIDGFLLSMPLSLSSGVLPVSLCSPIYRIIQTRELSGSTKNMQQWPWRGWNATIVLSQRGCPGLA